MKFKSLLIVAPSDCVRRLRDRIEDIAEDIETVFIRETIPSADDIPDGSRHDAFLFKRLPDDPDAALALLYAVERNGAEAFVTPDESVSSDWIETTPLDDRPLLRVAPRTDPLLQMVIKRILDLVGAILLLPLLLPVLALLGFLIRRESPGPVFYRQLRLGRFGRPFEILKLRTMPEGIEDATGPVWASEEDGRATPLGGVLRRLALDELPQIINVLKGEMSLVGPRPERPHFVEAHPKLEGRRLFVLPGLTGLAQVRLRKDASVEEKTRYDAWYIRRRSIGLDLRIIGKTVVKFAGRVREEVVAGVFTRPAAGG